MHPSQDQPLQRRERLNLALVLTVLMLTAVAATCASCAELAPVARRTPREQHNSTMMFRHVCAVKTPLFEPTGDADTDETLGMFLTASEEHTFVGSGVVISDNRVLTAAHVVECPKGKGEHQSLQVSPDGDVWMDATIEIIMPSRDVARVTVEGSLEKYMTPVQLATAAPEIGEVLCYASAWPRWSYKCGVTQPTPALDEIYVGIEPTEHGNSGSGVYAGGRLVGLLDAVWTCESGLPCVAMVEPVWDLPWLMP